MPKSEQILPPNSQSDNDQDQVRSPAFQFYPADWLSDERIQLMSLEEQGACLRALCYCWREGSIPADPKLLTRLIGCGCTDEVSRVVQGWFNQGSTERLKGGSTGSTRLVHPMLERERLKQQRWREKSALGGKVSAQKRQEIAKESITSKRKGGSTEPVEGWCNISSSISSSSSNNKDLIFTIPTSSPPSGGKKTPRGFTPKSDQTKHCSDVWLSQAEYEKLRERYANSGLSEEWLKRAIELYDSYLSKPSSKKGCKSKRDEYTDDYRVLISWPLREVTKEATEKLKLTRQRSISNAPPPWEKGKTETRSAPPPQAALKRVEVIVDSILDEIPLIGE